jgi:hypothetical protein
MTSFFQPSLIHVQAEDRMIGFGFPQMTMGICSVRRHLPVGCFGSERPGVLSIYRWILQLEKSKDLSGRLTCYELADNSASTLRARPGCFQVIRPGANYQQGRQKKVKRGADMHELCTLSWGIVCFPLLNRRTSLYPVASSSHQS